MVGILIGRSSLSACACTFITSSACAICGDDGRAGSVSGAHDDHALGEAFYTGVREALESFCETGRAVMAC